MGKIITFWSNVHGQGTTSNTIAVALYISIKFGLKCLITHTQYDNFDLENALMIEEDKESVYNFEDTGLDAIERACKANLLNPDNFSSFTKTLISGRLELLCGTSKTNIELYNNMSKTFPYILNCAKKSYDIIFLDVNSGDKNILTNIALENSDSIIINLNQNINALKRFFTSSNKHYVLDGYYKNIKDGSIVTREDIVHKSLSEYKYVDPKPYSTVIGNYNNKSKYTFKYISKLFKLKNELDYIPYNIYYSDAKNDNKALEFFYGNSEIDSNDHNYNFITAVEMLSYKILQSLNIDLKYVKKYRSSNSLLDLIFKILRV